MVHFRLVDHSIKPGIKIVEIWNGDTLMGTIYPTERGIKLVSKYIVDDPEGAVEVDRSKLPPIPAILINILSRPMG